MVPLIIVALYILAAVLNLELFNMDLIYKSYIIEGTNQTYIQCLLMSLSKQDFILLIFYPLPQS